MKISKRGLVFLNGFGFGVLGGATSIAASPVLGICVYLGGLGLVVWTIKESGMLEEKKEEKKEE